MTEVAATKLLAVLIDGDNFPADLAAPLFAAVSKLGNVGIRRVYGSSSGINGWRNASERYGIGLHEALPGKNAADMKLAIDAMDIHHRGKVGGFCIVSSDSDFAELAKRLREDGVTVDGFGSSNTASGFRQACDSFLTLDKSPPVESGPASLASPIRPSAVQSPAFAKWLELLARALVKLQTGRAQVGLSELAQQLQLLDKDFSAKKYGATNLKALVIKSGLEMKKVAGHWKVVLPPDLRQAA